MDFVKFPKIPRLSRDVILTEKLDGSNFQLYIGESGEFLVGSRNRWITPDDDNYGTAKWAYEHKEDLLVLGKGRHFGEIWGQGIQRNYGLKEKRFSLFNVSRPPERVPTCCSLVPVLYKGEFDTQVINQVLQALCFSGSVAVPGFLKPEGICIYHTASGHYYKKTIENDSTPKSVKENTNEQKLG